jgi:thiosulfate dehydrogenase [quinone] large subunit
LSRRDRNQRRGYARATGHGESDLRPGGRPDRGPAGPSIREQFERATVPARALLPARIFFGATFLYAGVDKLIDPTFFDAANPASIVGQLAAFAHVSPLAFLVRLSEPFAIPIGILIAIAEIAIGLGALTGLAYRLAAAGGAALSLLFWLTASWTTTPFYYGPDLPYAFGWAALAIAGDGGLLVPAFVRTLGTRVTEAMPWAPRSWFPAGAGAVRSGASIVEEPSPARRLMLQAGVLGAASLAVSALAVPVRVLRPAAQDGGETAAGSATPTPDLPQATDNPSDDAGSTDDPSDDPTATPASASFKPSGLTVASIASVDQKGAIRIKVPANAPDPLPAGDPGIIVKLADGTYVGYDARCTHEGCKVGWDKADGVLLCPCHGAAFDPADHGAVLGGPTRRPLVELPLVIDAVAGTITLRV